MTISCQCPACGFSTPLAEHDSGPLPFCERCGQPMIVSPVVASGPVGTPTPRSDSKFPAWLRLTLLTFGGAVLLFGVFGPLILVPMNAARVHPRWGACSSDMRQVGMAMFNYESRIRDGRFPAPISPPVEGEFPRSWRTEMLPYLDQQGLYSAYDKRQPWDGPNNRELHAYLELFVCPANQDETLVPKSNFVVVNGESCIFNFTTVRRSKEIEQGGGLQNTILLVESSRERILWPEPRDLEFADSLATVGTPKSAISSHHPEGFNVIFADGHAELIRHTIDPKVLRAMLTYLADE